jgi:hypothetical protein
MPSREHQSPPRQMPEGSMEKNDLGGSIPQGAGARGAGEARGGGYGRDGGIEPSQPRHASRGGIELLQVWVGGSKEGLPCWKSA